MTYTIAGDDAALFSINATTGALKFLVAPDFETKKDKDLNNKYELAITATAGGASAVQALTVTITDVSTPGLKVVFPTSGSNVGTLSTVPAFSIIAKFDDTESGVALPVTLVEATGQNGEVTSLQKNGNLWVNKIVVLKGTNKVTVSTDYLGKHYEVIQEFRNEVVIKPEAMALSVKDSQLFVFNAMNNSLNSISLLDNTDISEIASLGAYGGSGIYPQLSEYESNISKGWGYTVAKTSNSNFYVVRLKTGPVTSLNYVQLVNGFVNSNDLFKDPTSLVLDENNDAIPSNDRLLVLHHKDNKGVVSSLNVGDKVANGTNLTLNPALPSLYTTLWEQPADITNADKIAFDAKTNSLIVLDKKAASTDVVIYSYNATTSRYDIQKSKTAIGINYSRVVVNQTTGKVYVGSGSFLANSLKVTSIDIATGVAATAYDGVLGSGQKLTSITDMRVNQNNNTLYVLDGAANSIISINLTTSARTLFKNFSVSTGVSFLPNDIAFDGFNNIFVTDSNSGGIVGVDATNGKRVVVRPGITSAGSNSVAQQLKYNDVNGLVTLEALQDNNGLETARTLAKTDVLSGTSSLLFPFASTYVAEQFGIYVDATYGNFAVTTKGSVISITDLATGKVTLYNPATNYGITPDAVTAVEIDQKSGLLFAINNVSKKLISLDLTQENAMPKELASLEGVTKPSSIKLDGNVVYYLDTGELVKVDLSSTAAAKFTIVTAAKLTTYPADYSTDGVYALGEHLDLDRKNKVAWISNKAGGAVIGVSLITGDRIVVSH